MKFVAMTEYKETMCRLCHKHITDKDFKVIDGAIRVILDDLLLNLKFNGDSEVICNYCIRKLNATLDFKSKCIDINNIIIRHMDCETMLQLDLREIYIKENGSRDVTNISYDDKICLLCMELIKNEIKCLGEEELEAIKKFVPEMNIMIVKDPVICRPCFDSLSTHNTFLEYCLGVDQRITDIFDSSAEDAKTYGLSSDLFIKTDRFHKESEIEMAVKTEFADIKTEEGEGSDKLLLCLDNETFENSNHKGLENQESECTGKDKDTPIGKCSTEAGKDSFPFHQFKDGPFYKCDKCTYETNRKIRFIAHYTKHDNSSKVYKCDACSYETKEKRLLKSHKIRHKDLSEVEIYKCNDCDYKTKYKNSIKYHILKHINPSEVQPYKCNSCDYKSYNKIYFTQHQLTHKDSSEVPMYSCEDCEYKTKYKSNIQCHILQHKDPSQVRIYKCDACPYESRFKRNVTKHQLMHKDFSDVQIYSCNDCGYTTRYKRNMKPHVLKHRGLL